MSWPLVKLGELVTIKGGGTPSKKIEEYWNGNIPWASVKDLKSNEISKTVDTITELGVNNSATNVIPAGTILTATRMALGKFAINTVDMAINQDLKALFINNETKVDRDFLIRFLESQAQFIDSEGKGATVKGITLDFLKSLEIPLPPLDEQKRIAAILDKADAIRRKRQQAIQLADDFLRSVFLDMFGDPVTNPKGWEVKPLKLLCNIKGGGTPSKSNDSFWGGDIPWVSPKDMKSLYISSSKDKITSEAIKGSSTKLIDKDSVLMVVRSGVLKHTVPLALTTKPVSINQDMKAFLCRSDLNPHYLLFCLKAFSQFLLGTVRGTTADNLSSDVINNLAVPLPPVEVQEKFAFIAQKQECAKIKKTTSKELSHLSFNSLSQKAFAGEL